MTSYSVLGLLARLLALPDATSLGASDFRKTQMSPLITLFR